MIFSIFFVKLDNHDVKSLGRKLVFKVKRLALKIDLGVGIHENLYKHLMIRAHVKKLVTVVILECL